MLRIGEVALQAAPLGAPRPGARRGAPRTSAGIGDKPAETGGARVAMAHHDGDRTVGRDPTADIDGDVAAVGENAVDDAHGIAIARDAVALVRDNRYAPQAVIARHGKARRRGECDGRSGERTGDQTGAVL